MHVQRTRRRVGAHLGIERLDGEGSTEHLALQYADDVKVYVPVTKIELCQRYIGSKGFLPKLSKVGGVAKDLLPFLVAGDSQQRGESLRQRRGG